MRVTSKRSSTGKKFIDGILIRDSLAKEISNQEQRKKVDILYKRDERDQMLRNQQQKIIFETELSNQEKQRKLEMSEQYKMSIELKQREMHEMRLIEKITDKQDIDRAVNDAELSIQAEQSKRRIQQEMNSNEQEITRNIR